jgi:membrane-associated phospholipid phosphatase
MLQREQPLLCHIRRRKQPSAHTSMNSGRRNRQNWFGRALALWGSYRRLILIFLITTALGFFLTSLEPANRRLIAIGLFARRSLVLLLIFFMLTVLSLVFSAGQRLDTAIFLFFNLRGYHPRWLDRVMWVFTQIGNGAFGLLLSVTFYFAGNRRFAVELLLGILTLWLAVELVKAIVERSRPFLIVEGTRIIGWRERGTSFPSGHTSQAFFMASLLAQAFPLGALFSGSLFLIAALVGFTRIYVGAHYPRDVIGGAIFGSVWGILTSLLEVYIVTGKF